MEAVLTRELGRSPRGKQRRDWEQLGWGAWWRPHRSTAESLGNSPVRWELSQSRFTAQILTVMKRLPAGSTLDGLAAAHWWGLPISGHYGRIDVITGVAHSRHRRVRRGVNAVVVAPSSRHLPEHAITIRHGIRVLKLEYLCAELLVRLPIRQSLPVVEAAITRVLNPSPLMRDHVESQFAALVADIRRILNQRRWRRGVRRAQAALDYLSPWSQSVGETLTKLLMYEAGLPPAIQQLPIHCDKFWIWPDFAWPKEGIVVEFDGLEKYRGRERHALREEKLREECLRPSFPHIYRVLWEDLQNGHALDLFRRLGAEHFAIQRE